MGEPAEVQKTEDKGLEIGTARLTQDKIEKTINSVLKGETGARHYLPNPDSIHALLRRFNASDVEASTRP